MTLDEYNKSRPNEQIIYKDAKIVIRVNNRVDVNGDATRDNEVHLFVHSVSADGCEQLPLGYMLGSNALIYKIRD